MPISRLISNTEIVGKFTSLSKSTLTRSWSLEERSALAFFFEKQELKKDDFLFLENSEESRMYLVDKGRLKVSSGSIEIELGPGSSLGELSLLQKTRKQTNAQALEDCSFWVLTKEAWEKLKEESPSTAFKLTEAINQKLADLLLNSGPPSVLRALSESSRAN